MTLAYRRASLRLATRTTTGIQGNWGPGHSVDNVCPWIPVGCSRRAALAATASRNARIDSIAHGGPILFSDVSGGGQDRPIYVSHSGTDAKTGWQVIDAHPTGARVDCFLKWSASRDLFTTTCDHRTFPPDGGAQHHYKWKVSGGELLIQLNAA